MLTTPYVHVSKSRSGHIAVFTLLLSDIARAPKDARTPTDAKVFAQSVLNQQTDFIATLVGLGKGAAIEIRYLCYPNVEFPQEGQIEVAIRVRVVDASAAAAKDSALSLYQSFLPNLLSISNLYSWRAVESAVEYERLIPEKATWHVKEMLRRERYVQLEKLSHGAAGNPIGFIADDEVSRAAEEGKVYVCFPFLRNYETLKGLFTEMLYQEHPVIICVRLAPTNATEQEYQFLLEQLLACERYMQLPLHGSVVDPSSFFPSLRQQSSILAEQIQNELSILRDDVFVTTVHYLSAASTSPMLCESIGVGITEHLQTSDPASDMAESSRNAPFNGGYDWVAPESAVETGRTIEKISMLEYAGISTGLLDAALRLRRLFGVNQASCAFRLPVPVHQEFPGLRTSRVTKLPPPSQCASGLALGINSYGSAQHRVLMQPEDRLRHTYVVGKTGTGKSTFLKNCVMQDILAGNGVGVFDPHGELVDEILDYIPEERIADVVLIRPELQHCAVGLNLFDVETELEKDSVINYLIEVFQTIFDMQAAGGPMFEMYFRNAALLLLEKNDPPCTIMDMHRIFSDREFLTAKLDACTDPLVVRFWRGQALRVSGDHSLSEIGPYITSKLVRLTHSLTMRRIFSQRRSTIDFADIIESKKILLVDLSKGELGGLSSSFLGMTLIKLLQMVAFRRRASSAAAPPTPYYLYFDEFQNLATPSFLDLLSESRKYGLAMTLANQYIKQIPENIRNAIVGNVGATISFRVGLEDAKVLEDSFAPSLAAADFINLPNFNAYVSMLRNGDVCRPFNIATDSIEYERTPNSCAEILERMTAYTKLVDQSEGYPF